MISFALIAVAISLANVVVGRRYAKVYSANDDSVNVMFPEPRIVEKNGRYRLTLRSRHHFAADVARTIGLDQLIASQEARERFEVTFESFEREALEELIDLWPTGDSDKQSAEDLVTISGLVRDQSDRPVTYAAVDVIQSEQIISTGITRSDGSFTVGLRTLPSEKTFQIRFTFGDGTKQMATRPLVFDPRAKEYLLLVELRR